MTRKTKNNILFNTLRQYWRFVALCIILGTMAGALHIKNSFEYTSRSMIEIGYFMDGSHKVLTEPTHILAEKLKNSFAEETKKSRTKVTEERELIESITFTVRPVLVLRPGLNNRPPESELKGDIPPVISTVSNSVLIYAKGKTQKEMDEIFEKVIAQHLDRLAKIENRLAKSYGDPVAKTTQITPPITYNNCTMSCRVTIPALYATGGFLFALIVLMGLALVRQKP